MKLTIKMKFLAALCFVSFVATFLAPKPNRNGSLEFTDNVSSMCNRVLDPNFSAPSTNGGTCEGNGVWTIGFCTASDPLEWNCLKHPIITAKDVTDISARFVADPFVIFHDSKYFMFFETMPKQMGANAVISVSTSYDLITWTYKQVVLKENFHLSYPFVVKEGNTFYMIPETNDAHQVRLYSSSEEHFPFKWTFELVLLNGRYVDSSVIKFSGTWFLFTKTPFKDTVELFYSDSILGPYKTHKQSPIIKNSPEHGRPAGRPIATNDGSLIYLWTMDASHAGVYGYGVGAIGITELSKEKYSTSKFGERSHVLGPHHAKMNNSWNVDGMHTLDAHFVGNKNCEFVAFVDGLKLCNKTRTF